MNQPRDDNDPTATPAVFRDRPVTIWREPLLHFLILGLLLVGIDHIANPPDDNDRLIVIDGQVRQMLIEKFIDGRGREPSADEYEELVRLWAKNEIMYREARALGLDQGDEMIRERIILKMRNLVFGNITIRQPDPGELQAWLAAHRERYDLPRRFAFEQVMLGVDEDAATVLAAARAADAVPAPQANRLRRYGNRSREAVATTFGEAFADAVATAAPGDWLLLESDDGRHLARVTAVQEAVPATLESHRGRIEADWQEAQAQLSMMDQLADLRARYELRRQDGGSATNTTTLASRADGNG